MCLLNEWPIALGIIPSTFSLALNPVAEFFSLTVSICTSQDFSLGLFKLPFPQISPSDLGSREQERTGVPFTITNSACHTGTVICIVGAHSVFVLFNIPLVPPLTYVGVFYFIPLVSCLLPWCQVHQSHAPCLWPLSQELIGFKVNHASLHRFPATSLKDSASS